MAERKNKATKHTGDAHALFKLMGLTAPEDRERFRALARLGEQAEPTRQHAVVETDHSAATAEEAEGDAELEADTQRDAGP
jgi:hypothetical protein